MSGPTSRRRSPTGCRTAGSTTCASTWWPGWAPWSPTRRSIGSVTIHDGRAIMEISLDGWDIERRDDLEWGPWGAGDDARAKVLGAADGYNVALVQADPGDRGDPRVH